MEVLNTTTHTEETKPTRVSFATSPDKTIDSTPPTSPESHHAGTGNTHADGTFHTDEAAQHIEDDDFVNKKSSASSSPSKLLRVNKILCRVPSHESNISDLSASLSPSYRTRQVVTDAKDEGSITKTNPIMSLLSACGISGEISDLMNAHPNLGDGLLEKPNAETEKRMEKPAVWGMAPSRDEESVAKDYLNGFVGEKGAAAAAVVESSSNMDSDVSSSNASIVYDNVELILDEAALIPPTTQVAGRRSPFSANGILKNKLSGIVNGSNKTSKLEREPSISPPSVSIVNESPNQADSRISHTYDVASFQNEDLRPAPLPEKHLAEVSAAVVEGKERNVSPVDSITGEVNHVVENVQSIKRSSKSSKSSKTSKSSKSSEASVSEKSVSVAESDEKTSKRFGLPSFKRNKKKEKADATVKAEAKQDDANTENITESKIDADKSEGAEQIKSSVVTIEKPTKSRGLFFMKKKSQKQSTPPDSIQNTPSDPPSTTVPASTPSEEVIADARFWKATLDSASSQTYYYHSKTKVTTWTKPPGFDEAQKNKLWKAAVDTNSGMTYYYHSKTKEVRWTKPEGFVERKKKKKDDVGGTAIAAAKDVEEETVAAVTDIDAMKAGLSEDLNKEEDVDADRNEVMEIEEQQATSPDSQPEEEKTFDPTPAVEDSKASESFPEKPSSHDVSQKEPKKEEATAKHVAAADQVNAIEDAPFDELPLNPPAPREVSPQVEEDDEDDTFSLPSITEQVVESTDMKSIDYARSRTYASHLTDKTQRVNNTSATIPSKDFTNTQIAMNVNTDTTRDANHDRGLNPSSLDSALGHLSVDNPKTRSDSVAQEAAMPANGTLDDEDSDLFDEWDDEVSELSGIGNDEKVAMRKLLIERHARKNNNGMKDTRVDKSSTRNISSIPSSRDKNQTELDTFIAKDDWGSVSRYISEMRINRQHKVKRNQSSPSEIQQASKQNRRVENNVNAPRKQIGAKSQMQHDDMEDESSQESPVDSDSGSRSTYSQGDTTYEESTFYDASTYYDESTFYDESTIEQSTIGQSSRPRRRAK